MFHATMCPSSGEITAFMRHLVLLTLCGWLSGMQGGMKLLSFHPAYHSHPHRIISTKCRINAVVSPDDGHIVTRNMQRLLNILRINCAPIWLYLQDYTVIHGHQNIKYWLVVSYRHFGTTVPNLQRSSSHERILLVLLDSWR